MFWHSSIQFVDRNAQKMQMIIDFEGFIILHLQQPDGIKYWL